MVLLGPRTQYGETCHSFKIEPFAQSKQGKSALRRIANNGKVELGRLFRHTGSLLCEIALYPLPQTIYDTQLFFVRHSPRQTDGCVFTSFPRLLPLFPPSSSTAYFSYKPLYKRHKTHISLPLSCLYIFCKTPVKMFGNPDRPTTNQMPGVGSLSGEPNGNLLLRHVQPEARDRG